MSLMWHKNGQRRTYCQYLQKTKKQKTKNKDPQNPQNKQKTKTNKKQKQFKRRYDKLRKNLYRWLPKAYAIPSKDKWYQH